MRLERLGATGALSLACNVDQFWLGGVLFLKYMIVLSVTCLLLAGFVSTATEVSPPNKFPTAGVLCASIFTCEDALLHLPIWARGEYVMTGTQAWKQTLAQAARLLFFWLCALRLFN